MNSNTALHFLIVTHILSVKMARGKAISNDLRKVIINLHKKSLSYQKIADTINISRYSVHNIIDLYKNTQSIEQRKRIGRKSTITAQDLRSQTRTFGTGFHHQKVLISYIPCLNAGLISAKGNVTKWLKPMKFIIFYNKKYT